MAVHHFPLDLPRTCRWEIKGRLFEQLLANPWNRRARPQGVTPQLSELRVQKARHELGVSNFGVEDDLEVALQALGQRLLRCRGVRRSHLGQVHGIRLFGEAVEVAGRRRYVYLQYDFTEGIGHKPHAVGLLLYSLCKLDGREPTEGIAGDEPTQRGGFALRPGSKVLEQFLSVLTVGHILRREQLSIR